MAELRVATLNIWNRMGPWEARLASIRRQLASLNPDVMGLQEVILMTGEYEVDQAADIVSDMGYHIACGRAVDAKPWGLCNAIVSRFPIVRSLVFSLPGTDEARSVVFAEIDTPFGQLPFFSTHLNWRFDEGHIRTQQVRALASFVDSVAPRGDRSKLPAVVVGDFNAEPDADEIRFMRGLTGLGGSCVYYADCFGTVGEGGDGITFARRNPFAAPLREPDRRIDYVFVRREEPQDPLAPRSARVCFDEETDGVMASDHFGVVAVLDA